MRRKRTRTVPVMKDIHVTVSASSIVFLLLVVSYVPKIAFSYAKLLATYWKKGLNVVSPYMAKRHIY
jgi:hypothetical protein